MWRSSPHYYYQIPNGAFEKATRYINHLDLAVPLRQLEIYHWSTVPHGQLANAAGEGDKGYGQFGSWLGKSPRSSCLSMDRSFLGLDQHYCSMTDGVRSGICSWLDARISVRYCMALILSRCLNGSWDKDGRGCAVLNCGTSFYVVFGCFIRDGFDKNRCMRESFLE